MIQETISEKGHLDGNLRNNCDFMQGFNEEVYIQQWTNTKNLFTDCGSENCGFPWLCSASTGIHRFCANNACMYWIGLYGKGLEWNVRVCRD